MEDSQHEQDCRVATDGENVVFGANEPEKSDYTSYGFLSSGRFATSNQTDAARAGSTDPRRVKRGSTRLRCNQDTAANRALYGKCATDPTNYYAVSDPSKLPNVFREIAGKFTALQLVN